MGSGQQSGIETRIAKQIRAQGAVTVADFMRLALSARELGYYSSRDPLGAAGDFTTAPEISQMFGEMIGLWCVDTWQRLGAPQAINLVELGPGRGTLMADALRAAKLAPDFLAAIRLHLVEISAPLRERQADNLQAFQPQWHDSIETLPAGPLLVVANEFFDALPIHQFTMTESGWRERGVTLGDDDRFAWTLLPPGPQLALLPSSLRAAPLGAIAECSPASQRILGILAQHCLQSAGAALFIDYGPAASGFGDTFQALKAHRYHDPLQDVGDVDLTAHVDLPHLARLAQEAGCGSFGPVGQGDFLRALGIETRAAMLSRHQDHVTQQEIQTALHRLIDAAQMGTLFKVVAITSPGITELAGFA
ncbi:MAG TPA: class I SAM-dependent methyltransferase [Terriglobales bacterium]|nr:class I SAM-dependent methyltransferase [Terriglobales bacterium]